jgi:WD40 repeat protein
MADGKKNDRYILDADTGTVVANLTGHVALVENVSFSPDGQYLASAGPKNIISLYDVSSKQHIRDIPTGHSAKLRSLAYSPNGRLLASGARDKTVKIWDVQTGALLNTLRDHPDFVNSDSFTAAGDRLIAGGGPVVTIWEISK